MGFFDKLKNKNEYYYDFGTGNKIKREDSNKKDDFLEGFNSVTDTPIAKTLRYESEEEAKPVTLPYTKPKPRCHRIRRGFRNVQNSSGSRKPLVSDRQPAGKDRLHGVAEEVRRLSRGKNRVRYAHDEIFNLLHENAKTAQEYQKEFKNVKANPFLRQVQ